MGAAARMTLSLRFWAALQRPPVQHPLFRRAMRQYQPSFAPPRHSSRLGWTLLAVSGGGIAIFAPQAIAIVLLFVPLLIGAVYAFLFAPATGVVLATRVSALIARERERGLLDLIAMTPRGGFVGIWAICTGCQHYALTLRSHAMGNAWFARVMFLVVLYIYDTLIYAEPRVGLDFGAFIIILLSLVLIGIAFHIDDVHSVVIANLVGLLVPLLTRSRFDARLWALIGFVVLQAFAYLLTLGGGFGIAPLLLARLPLTWETEQIALMGAQFLLFFATREVFARLLWFALRVATRGEAETPRLRQGELETVERVNAHRLA